MRVSSLLVGRPIGTAARPSQSGEAQLMIAGGVEGMSRAPFAMLKAETAFSLANAACDKRLDWRFVNRRMSLRVGARWAEQASTISRAFAAPMSALGELTECPLLAGLSLTEPQTRCREAVARRQSGARIRSALPRTACGR